MNLHPYLTPALLTLIRTAKPHEITNHLDWRETGSKGFRVSAKRQKSYSLLYADRKPIVRIMLSSQWQGSSGIKRRVELENPNWRELFIEKLNEVLHDCDVKQEASRASQDADKERQKAVYQRIEAVLPLIEPWPKSVTWKCLNANSRSVEEYMKIDTAAFTPEQVAQIANFVRSFAP